jgi:hypothetical protein
LLGQLQQSNIQNIQMPAIQEMLSGATSMAGGLQSLDQQAIQNQLSQFEYVQPQNNPVLQDIMGMSALYPPTTATPTMGSQLLQLLGSASFNTSSGAGGSF